MKNIPPFSKLKKMQAQWLKIKIKKKPRLKIDYTSAMRYQWISAMMNGNASTWTAIWNPITRFSPLKYNVSFVRSLFLPTNLQWFYRQIAKAMISRPSFHRPNEREFIVADSPGKLCLSLATTTKIYMYKPSIHSCTANHRSRLPSLSSTFPSVLAIPAFVFIGTATFHNKYLVCRPVRIQYTDSITSPTASHPHLNQSWHVHLIIFYVGINNMPAHSSGWRFCGGGRGMRRGAWNQSSRDPCHHPSCSPKLHINIYIKWKMFRWPQPLRKAVAAGFFFFFFFLSLFFHLAKCRENVNWFEFSGRTSNVYICCPPFADGDMEGRRWGDGTTKNMVNVQCITLSLYLSHFHRMESQFIVCVRFSAASIQSLHFRGTFHLGLWYYH